MLAFWCISCYIMQIVCLDNCLFLLPESAIRNVGLNSKPELASRYIPIFMHLLLVHVSMHFPVASARQKDVVAIANTRFNRSSPTCTCEHICKIICAFCPYGPMLQYNEKYMFVLFFYPHPNRKHLTLKKFSLLFIYKRVGPHISPRETK